MNATLALTRRASPAGHFLVFVLLLWVTGIGPRVTILAVPPLIRMIHDDLGLTETQVGILSGLPPVLFGLAAVPGSLLIARCGAMPAVITGLLATSLGCALRGFASDFVLLCAATVLTGIGVAVMQPAMPPLVRAWLPERIGFGTAVYTNGLLVGEIIPVMLTIPLVLPFIGDSWRVAFLVWALPGAVFALMVLGLAPRPAGSAQPAVRPRWVPDWRSGLIWRLGLMFGATNATYFTTNAFIPDYLHHLGRPDLIGPALSALNAGQLPASLLLLAGAELERLLEVCEPTCLFFSARYAGLVAELHVSGLKEVICFDGAAGVGEPYEAWIAAGVDEEIDTPVSDTDLACLAFTSGTTGTPKAVMHSQAFTKFGTLQSIIERRLPETATTSHPPGFSSSEGTELPAWRRSLRSQALSNSSRALWPAWRRIDLTGDA